MLSTGICSASDRIVNEPLAYANFINGLVKKAELDKKEGALCVFGNNDIAKELLNIAGTIKRSSQNIDEYRSCKAVYIGLDGASGLRSYLLKLTTSKILTMGTSSDFFENGGMIQIEIGRRGFELTVDEDSINAARVKLDTLSTNLIVN